MSQQLYVMTPGSAQPELLTVDDLVAKIRAGQLTDAVSCARLGESTWTPAKDLSEVAALLSGATPEKKEASGIAATRVSAGPPPQRSDGPPPTHATPAPIPAVVVQRAAANAFAQFTARLRSSERGKMPPAVLAGLIGASAIVLFGTMLLVWYRNHFSHGAVFHHVPEDCAVVGYLDLDGIASSDPVHGSLEKLIKNGKDLSDESIEKSSKKQKERYEAALDALRKNGVDTFTVREGAFCVPTADDDDDKDSHAARPEEKGLLLLGGTFRKGDVLEGIKGALEAGLGKEDLCKIEEDDGLRMMKCSFEIFLEKRMTFYAALVEGTVLAVSPDRKMIKSVKASKDRAKDYDADKGEQFVFFLSKDAASYDGSFGTMRLKIGGSDTVLSIENHYDKKKGADKLAKLKDADAYAKRKEEHFKQAAKDCFEHSPIDMLSDAVEGASVEVLDDGVRYEIKFSNKDLQKAAKAAADADKDEVSKIVGTPTCVMRLVDPYVE